MDTTRIGRIPIVDVSPSLPGTNWSPKAFVGEVIPFEATIFREGHDAIGAALLLTAPSGAVTRVTLKLQGQGTDRWRADALLSELGDYTFVIEAYGDDAENWLHTADIKVDAGIDIDLVFLMGQQLFERGASDGARSKTERAMFTKLASTMADAQLAPTERLEAAHDPSVLAALSDRPIASLVTHSSEFTLHVEPRHAGVGSWYEFFPRSEGAVVGKDGAYKSGTFASATKRLPAVADMGFDVLYLPPIHPIGRIGRKGPNNTLMPGPGDPGSPWAIGSSEGGHDSVHPDLGTMADCEKFVKSANKLGLDVALDLALQAAPDHPWVAEHPEWFTTLPDGTIAYAENPPKKYQDIYPVNFDNDPQGIRDEVLRIVRLWISKGVRIFRVDNPHTKPVDFWEWLIGTVNAERPDVVFLAEAFTRPAMMQTLAKIGFQQSYSYFTWRNTKPELEEFFTSISHETAAWYRPNLFVNTPDILTEYLQFGGPAAFTIRATLAATAAPLWGVYAGFELFESVARAGAEEYIDNEKYEYKPRDWDAHAAAGTTLAPYLAQLNAVRAAHPALQQLRNLDVHWSDDDHVLVYTKHLDAAFTGTTRSDSLIIVVNTDPHSVRETTVHLDLTRLGLNPDARITVTDTITGAVFEWSRDNFVRLDPFTQPAHILHVTEVR